MHAATALSGPLDVAHNGCVDVRLEAEYPHAQSARACDIAVALYILASVRGNFQAESYPKRPSVHRSTSFAVEMTQL
jgi:hypothetical protein